MTGRDVFNIRKLAGAHGATQEHFAKQLGVPVRSYRNWEQGVRKPTGAALRLLRMVEAAPDEAILLMRMSAMTSGK